jgi:hypothetical protein
VFIPEWAIALAWFPAIALGVLLTLVGIAYARSFDRGYVRGFADRHDTVERRSWWRG